MNIAVWIVQILLGLAFLFSGAMKVFQPIDKLKAMMAWVESLPPTAVRLIGVVEVLGAFGLVLPAATGILPFLTPLAAAGLVLTMLGAMTLHLRRGGETGNIVANLVLLALAAFVVYGRLVAVPLT